jgi:hypothetical protein
VVRPTLLDVAEARQEVEHPAVVGEDVGPEAPEAAGDAGAEQVPRPFPCQPSWTTKATSGTSSVADDS